MWICDQDRFTNYSGATFITIELVIKLLLRKPQKRNSYRSIKIMKLSEAAIVLSFMQSQVLRTWNVSASLMKLRKCRDTKKPTSL